MSRTLLCFALLLCAVFASGQGISTAVLNGDVTDPQGAVVANAEVSATRIATGFTRTTYTTRSGLFVLNGLEPGEYDVQVTAKGFAAAKAKVRLEVGHQAELKLQLSLREQQTIISVDDTEALPIVDTVTSDVDGIVSARQIESLPLNGRNFLELAFLVPGNAPAPNFDPTKTTTVLVSSAGQLGRGGSVTIDGADNNDDVVGGSLHNVPQDAVQEFQIATNRYSAELGRSASSVVNVVTKSGTNDYHGSVSFFERDAALQGLPATFDRDLEAPPFDRQQYAGTLGGPLVKDKAWWFAGLEYRDQTGAVLAGQRDVASQTIVNTLAPAPLTDLLLTARGDWRVSDADTTMFRYSLDRSEETGASTLIRSIGSASERQTSQNHYQAFTAAWTRVITANVLNRFTFAENNFDNNIQPVSPGPQLTFPSIQDGSSFRVPQGTRQNRLEVSDTLSWVKGKHSFKFGGDFQRIDADFDLDVFREGRIELVEDFAPFDRNGDGLTDDNDLLFEVTLRSGHPDQGLVIPNADNNYVGFFVQDDWHLHPQFTLNLGLRYELDTNVKNLSGVDDLNPLILPYLQGTRGKDTNNWGPRIGMNWATKSGGFSIHAGYGIYYDRITLEIASLERGLDGRALPIEVRAGNVFFLTDEGTFGPGAPTLANPFSGFPLVGAGASGINIIDNDMQNPSVQQFNIGLQQQIGRDIVLRAEGIHNLGTHFIIGRQIAVVVNPDVGGPDPVKNLESSVNTKYDGLFLSAQKRFSGRYEFMASYTLSKAFNYANDDQIPFANGPIDPSDLGREYGLSPIDQRHRFVFSASVQLPMGFRFSPIWTMASGVPMDILLPDASERVNEFRRNAGGREYRTGTELNAAITERNAGLPYKEQLPFVSEDARFNDSFNSLDFRLSKTFAFGDRARLEVMGEAFNIFNVTNILGVSNQNYSGYRNALVRDSNDPGPVDDRNPAYLRSSSFGRPSTTAGGVFGSGGPRAFQLGARFSF
jgi:hypothetical protein